MVKPFKWAAVGDLQIPYHDKRAVALFLKVMKSWKPDAIDFVGDIDDQLEYSRFSDGRADEFFSQLAKNDKANAKAISDYEKAMTKWRATEDNPEPIPVLAAPENVNPLPFVKANAQEAGKFYADVRKQHPDTDLNSSLGNHDIRVFDYVDRKAPEYLEEVTPNMLWGLDDLGITWTLYDDPPKERFAGIHVHHGKTVSSSGLSVKADIENYNISLIRGHDHKGGVVYSTYPLANRTLVGMNTGHMCDPKAYGLRYTVNPTWELGFGIAEISDGVAQLQFIPIVETDKGYRCIVDGKVFYG